VVAFELAQARLVRLRQLPKLPLVGGFHIRHGPLVPRLNSIQSRL
jgi:hypothetical protein